MNKKSLSFLFSLAATALVFGILLFQFYNTPYFDTFLAWAKNNSLIFFIILILLKIIGVVYPPIPGSVFTLGSIPIIGWQTAYLAEFTGSMLGASFSYYLGARYGKRLIVKFFGEESFEKFIKIKIKQKNQIETVVLLRIAGGTIIELVNYAAPLLKINYKSFLIGSIVVHPVIGIPLFFSAGRILQGNNILLMAGLILITMGILYKFRGRYFE